MLEKHLFENSYKLMNTAEKAMVRLFSPYPTFTVISCNGGESSSYIAAKVVAERKLICLKEQMEYNTMF